MLSLKNLLFGSALLASTAVAHFTLDYPPTRGFDEDIETEYCGGYNTPTSPRNSFPLGSVQFTSHHTLATVDILISTAEDPTSFSNFSDTFVKSFFQVGEGSYCVNVDLSSLGLGLTNGSEVTIQMQFNGGDGDLFQCSDLVLLSNYTAPSNETCASDASTLANATVSTTTSASATGSATAAASATSSSAAGREAAAYGGLMAFGMMAVGLITL